MGHQFIEKGIGLGIKAGKLIRPNVGSNATQTQLGVDVAAKVFFCRFQSMPDAIRPSVGDSSDKFDQAIIVREWSHERGWNRRTLANTEGENAGALHGMIVTKLNDGMFRVEAGGRCRNGTITRQANPFGSIDRISNAAQSILRIRNVPINMTVAIACVSGPASSILVEKLGMGTCLPRSPRTRRIRISTRASAADRATV